jgi:transcription-repair coupling factor (superfamily II helicase)
VGVVEIIYSAGGGRDVSLYVAANWMTKINRHTSEDEKLFLQDLNRMQWRWEREKEKREIINLHLY